MALAALMQIACQAVRPILCIAAAVQVRAAARCPALAGRSAAQPAGTWLDRRVPWLLSRADWRGQGDVSELLPSKGSAGKASGTSAASSNALLSVVLCWPRTCKPKLPAAVSSSAAVPQASAFHRRPAACQRQTASLVRIGGSAVATMASDRLHGISSTRHKVAMQVYTEPTAIFAGFAVTRACTAWT